MELNIIVSDHYQQSNTIFPDRCMNEGEGVGGRVIAKQTVRIIDMTVNNVRDV